MEVKAESSVTYPLEARMRDYCDEAVSPQESPSPHDDIRAHLDAEGNLKFDPPLYRQRYEVVKKVLEKEVSAASLITVLEFGCAELAMFAHFKQIPNVTKIIMVDIDQSILDSYCCRAAPLNCDYLQPRVNPLHVEVLCGSVADCDARLLGADAVVCIELIEHLELDIVEHLEKTIFGFVEPKIAIFTTPNSDFNVLLKGMQGKFRHWDHKFEWSRTEFEDWTTNVTSKFPHYDVEIRGIGMPPEGHENVGHCSQMALFTRRKDYFPLKDKDAKEIYTVCRIYDHPVQRPDLRSEEEKLRDEVNYQLQKLGHYECYQVSEDYSHVPVKILLDAVLASIPSTNVDAIRHLFPPDEVVEKDGALYVTFHMFNSRYSSSESETEDSHEWFESGSNFEHSFVYPQEEENWDCNTPPVLETSHLVDVHMAMATFDNALNLMYERSAQIYECPDWMYGEDSEDDDSDERSSGLVNLVPTQDCEKMWNSLAPPDKFFCSERDKPFEHNNSMKIMEDSNVPCSSSLVVDLAGCCASSSAVVKTDCLFLDSKSKPTSDSNVDFSSLLEEGFGGNKLRSMHSQDHKTIHNTKDFPKSTSVEVLHLDGSCISKRPAGLEYTEYTPCSSVTLCYTGQTYCRSAKLSAGCDTSFSSEGKSLDGSLIRDTADSYSLDFAADSGYPNSSSLHHDVDIDLTPEQVDDISSENGERSNQSLSEDELSDSSDKEAALPRRVLHPRHPIIPIVFENVENGDLANNNRDGEGNNAVAPLGDEREFIALVQEGEMQPLLAAPNVDDIILPNNADPFPDWLRDLLRIDEGEAHVDEILDVKAASELNYDEGFGDDAA